MSIYSLSTTTSSVKTETIPADKPQLKSITSIIEEGETLYAIFQKNDLSINELFAMKQASEDIHPLRHVHPGKSYNITADDNKRINSFTYEINDNTTLKIKRCDNGFSAEKFVIPYESRVLALQGRIDDCLINAVGSDGENMLLALQLSDILAWDIDFNTDLRSGDTFRIIVEGLYLNGKFNKYGNILALEFVNGGKKISAYRFEHDGRTDYYDSEGKSLRKAFLKAPLIFRRISSSFSHSRLHPILKIYRPHHGIDYAAPKGTPVNAMADGKVSFAGYKGDYGRLIILSHSNGYSTYYGHLSSIAKNIQRGKRVRQGDFIGRVGATGLATGPHLHFEMRQNGKPINPAKIKTVKGKPILKNYVEPFKKVVARFDMTFESGTFYETTGIEKRRNQKEIALRPEDFHLMN